MRKFAWQQMRLIDRVRWLRYILPPLLVFVVVFYQLGIAQALENNFGHTVHHGVEVAFYSLTGPVVTWLMLVWMERKLEDLNTGAARLATTIKTNFEELGI